MFKFLSKFLWLSYIAGSAIILIALISNEEFKGKNNLLYTIGIYTSYTFATISALVTLLVLISKRNLLRRKKVIKMFSISVSIYIFAVLSSSMPSINRYDEPSLQTLKENLNKVYQEAIYLNHANKFKELKSEYSDESKEIGYTHFKVKESENLKYNFSLLERGDFINEDMKLTVVNTKNTNGENSETFFTSKNISDIGNDKYITLDYSNSLNIQNSSSIALSMDISTKTSKCFILLIEQYKEKNKIAKSTIKNDFCISEKNKMTKIFKLHQYSIAADTKQLRFSLVPLELENNYLMLNPWSYLKNNSVNQPDSLESTIWNISNINLSMDKSGLARETEDFCIEGFHDATPEYIFSIQEGKFSQKSCAQRDL